MYVQLKDFPSYLVTDRGEIISMGYRHPKSGREKPQWRKLNPFWRNGYKMVTLRCQKTNNIKYLRVHKLVAEIFVPNPLNLPFVNHINGIKHDNRAENLEWVDARGNAQHAWALGLSKPQLGEENKSAKLTATSVLSMRADHRSGMGYRKLSAKYGVSVSAVREAVLRINWKHI